MNHWLEAARLRTLPLALSSICMGSVLAATKGMFDWTIFALAVLTTIFLQVLSNFANDYGDTKNGADLTGRVGPRRAVQAGLISPEKMFQGIVLMAALSLIAGLVLLYVAFWENQKNLFWIFLGIGLLSILAAYTYTAGRKPYGYAGLGDISVLLFFGIVGVFGCSILFTKDLIGGFFLPALATGFLATGVLNLNNIRDIESDRKAGKMTIPARLGEYPARLYHTLLLVMSLIAISLYLKENPPKNQLYIVGFALVGMHLFFFWKTKQVDPLLKQLAIFSLLFTLFFGLSYLSIF